MTDAHPLLQVAVEHMSLRDISHATCTVLGMDSLRNWVPDYLEIGTWKHCLYCGETPDSVDHVIPVAYFAPTRRNRKGMHGRGLVAPACSECNSLLGDSMFPSLCERVSFVNEKIAFRYRKALGFPIWEESELEDISPSMANNIRANMRERSSIESRLVWIYSPTLLDLKIAALRKAESLFPDNKQLHGYLGCFA